MFEYPMLIFLEGFWRFAASRCVEICVGSSAEFAGIDQAPLAFDLGIMWIRQDNARNQLSLGIVEKAPIFIVIRKIAFHAEGLIYKNVESPSKSTRKWVGH